MSDQAFIYKIFHDSRNVAADNAIVAAMPLVPADIQRRLVRILFAHASDESLAAIPELFHLIDESVRSEIIANTAHLFGSLRITSRSPTSQTRLNSIEIIRRSLNPRLAYLAAVALSDGSVPIRAEAAATLRHLTTYHCRCHQETAAILRDAAADPDLAHSIVQTLQMVRDERRHLLEALRSALLHFESHHRPEVVEAAMLLADELEADLFHENTFRRGKLTQAMMETLSDHLSPEMAPFVYVALCYPEPRRRVLAALAVARDDAFFAELIRFQWLAREPRVRRALAAVKSLAWLADPMHAAFSLPADAAALAPAWILALGLPADHKIAALRQFTLIDNQNAARAAAWALVDLEMPAATNALHRLLEHDNPDIRHIAQREIEHRQRRENRIQPPRLNRPEGWVRLLHRAGIDEDFEQIWNRFDQLDPAEARASGPAALRYVAGFVSQLQLRLAGQLAHDRLRAVRLIIALNVVHPFARSLFNLANDADAEVRAAVMAAFARLRDPTARRILERALSDDAPEVQAAAIDAIDALYAIDDSADRRRADLLNHHADSPHAPVRAAAVRTLLRMHQPRAANDILKMLQDPRPDHRCHALWIVDQLNLAPLRQRIVEMNHNDPDPRIARIAHHVVRRLARDLVPATAAQPAGLDNQTADSPLATIAARRFAVANDATDGDATCSS